MSFLNSLKTKLHKQILTFRSKSGYNLKFFGNDTLAGITLAAYAIPVSLAYATLAGLPPQYGIYGYLIGGVFYAMLGTGKQLAIGPTSAISMIIGVTLADYAAGDIQRWIDLASMSAMLVAVMSLLSYVLRLSSIINFISETVLLGFKAGAAIMIALSQLPKLFGVPGGGDNFLGRLSVLISQLPDTNVIVLLFGLTALILLIAGERILPGKPVAIFVVAISILVITFVPLPSAEIRTVGELPSGLPKLHIPSFHFRDIVSMLPLAFACFLLAYVESVSAAKTLAQSHRYEIDPGKELLALGVANLAVSLGHGYPVSGGLSQSAVNDKAGAKTPVSLVVASIAIGLCLVFLTGLLKNLPYMILASIVLVAIGGLVDITEMKRLFRVNKFDFIIAMTALLSVIIFGILQGVLIGSLFSLMLIIRSVSSPHIAFLGRIPGTNRFTDISRHPHNELVPGIMIFRVESPIVYFNVSFVYQTVMSKIQAEKTGLNTVIIDLSTSAYIDSSGARFIRKLYFDLEDIGIRLRVAEAHSKARDMMRLEKIEDLMGHLSRRDELEEIVLSSVSDEDRVVLKPASKPGRKDTARILSQIIVGNNYFTKTHSKQYFDSFRYRQRPYITLVTCSDSRVPLTALMPDTSNKVFSIQNIGNQVLSTEGSVDYGIYHLKTPLLLFLGHSDCGAIKAYLEGYEEESHGIKHELDFLKPMIRKISGQDDFEKLHAEVIEKNLDYQVNIATKKYRDLIQSGKLTVMAGYYDFRGEYGKGKGNILIVNVNKIKDVQKMREHPAFDYLSDEQKEIHIGRLRI